MGTRDRLHPSIASVVEGIDVTISPENLPLMRMEFPVELSDRVTRTDHLVPGMPPVEVRAHRPTRAEEPQPGLVWIHGGGYVLGNHRNDDAMFDDLCPRLGMVAVSIGYRLAPETPYPGAIDDCYQALRWTFAHAEELGIRPDRIGIGGLSAGGGLAAALALLARDRGEVPVAFQMLDSPMLDDRQITASSQQDDMPLWSRDANRFGWESYLGSLHGSSEVPYTAAPARADDLSGLPPAFVSVGGLDGFCDEDVDYAMRLNRAGVPTELHVYPGACHGYLIASDSPITIQAARDRDDWLARQLRP
ncbi:MAG TPA: alpha/beta hydrolase [Acidimicrobiales bacterium]